MKNLKGVLAVGLLAIVITHGSRVPEREDTPEDTADMHHHTQTLATISALMSVCGSLYIIHSYLQNLQRLKVSSVMPN
jgi:hypothetical protein